MTAWAKDQGCNEDGSLIKFYADTRSQLTQALGLVLDAPPVLEKLGNPRCKRCSFLVDNGVFKHVNVVGEKVTDEDTFVERMLTQC